MILSCSYENIQTPINDLMWWLGWTSKESPSLAIKAYRKTTVLYSNCWDWQYGVSWIQCPNVQSQMNQNHVPRRSMVISEMEARVSLLVTWVCTYFPPLLVVLIICRERGGGSYSLQKVMLTYLHRDSGAIRKSMTDACTTKIIFVICVLIPVICVRMCTYLCVYVCMRVWVCVYVCVYTSVHQLFEK